VQKLARILSYVRLGKIAVWMAFLLVFPAFAFMLGMYAATALLSVLGILLDVTELGSLLPSSTPPKIQRGVVVTVALLHASLLVACCVRLVAPRYGAWQRLEGTDVWNNLSLVRATHGPLLAVGGRDVFTLGEDGARRAVPGIEGPVNVLGAGAHRAWFVSVEGKAAWSYDGSSLTTVPLGWGPAQEALVGAALDDAFFVVRRGALVRVELDGHPREVIQDASITGVDTDGKRVVAVGKHVFVSEDEGRRFEDRGPLELPAPSVYAGGGSYYVVQGGLLTSQLFVSEAGRALEKRDTPVRDVRILEVDPQDGQRVWLASWGEGVWRSEDGGRSWHDLELEGLEAQALVVNFARELAGGEAWVAATNLAIPSGIFHYAPH